MCELTLNEAMSQIIRPLSKRLLVFGSADVGQSASTTPYFNVLYWLTPDIDTPTFTFPGHQRPVL
jgi:hypothetical protein